MGGPKRCTSNKAHGTSRTMSRSSGSLENGQRKRSDNQRKEDIRPPGRDKAIRSGGWTLGAYPTREEPSPYLLCRGLDIGIHYRWSNAGIFTNSLVCPFALHLLTPLPPPPPPPFHPLFLRTSPLDVPLHPPRLFPATPLLLSSFPSTRGAYQTKLRYGGYRVKQQVQPRFADRLDNRSTSR